MEKTQEFINKDHELAFAKREMLNSATSKEQKLLIQVSWSIEDLDNKITKLNQKINLIFLLPICRNFYHSDFKGVCIKA